MELNKENDCMLYRHIRIDKNEVFYIGISIAEHHSKIVLDTQNGIYYKNAKEAAEILNIKYSTIKCWLNGSRRNPSNLIYA